MEMLCPECMGLLEFIDGSRVRCTLDGRIYDVLYVRNDVFADTVANKSVNVVGLGVQCVNHPKVEAARYCQNCRASICQTCDFALPGGVHLCPTCATTPQTEISPKRKKLVWWSIGLAIWSTVWFVIMMMASAIAAPADRQAIAIGASLLTLTPCLIGTALGVASFDRRLANPGIVWLGPIWNGIILGLMIILTIIGSAAM